MFSSSSDRSIGSSSSLEGTVSSFYTPRVKFSALNNYPFLGTEFINSLFINVGFVRDFMWLCFYTEFKNELKGLEISYLFEVKIDGLSFLASFYDKSFGELGSWDSPTILLLLITNFFLLILSSLYLELLDYSLISSFSSVWSSSSWAIYFSSFFNMKSLRIII